MVLVAQEAFHQTEFMEIGPGHDHHVAQGVQDVQGLVAHVEREEDRLPVLLEDPTQDHLSAPGHALGHQRGRGHPRGQDQGQSHQRGHDQGHQESLDQGVEDQGLVLALVGSHMINHLEGPGPSHLIVPAHMMARMINQDLNRSQGQGPGQGQGQSPTRRLSKVVTRGNERHQS